jgi:hypothetical protein
LASKPRNLIRHHLRHSHYDPAFCQRPETHDPLQHSHPTEPVYKPQKAEWPSHSSRQRIYFGEASSHPAHFASPHLRTYPHLQPLTLRAHQHLHTYPPFKGGKCNSGSGQHAGGRLNSKPFSVRKARNRIWTWKH